MFELQAGASSEVWNQVYTIALVKKFGRVRLSTIFLQNKYGGEGRHGGDDEFLLGFEFCRVQTPRKYFKIIFNGIFGQQEARCMNSSWATTLIVTDSASRQVQLFI